MKYILLIISALFLAGCEFKVDPAEPDTIPPQQAIYDTLCIYGVAYYKQKYDRGVGITVLYNRDGSIMLCEDIPRLKSTT